MARKRDHIEQSLFAELARLRERMRQINEQGGCQDPDSVMEELDEETRSINRMMQAIIKDIESVSGGRSDLNSVADEAAQQLLSSVTFPVVVLTSLQPRLPDVLLPPDLLRPIVQRALRITAEHGGAGCEVKVSSSTRNGVAVLDLEATNTSIGLRSEVPIMVRSTSLLQLIKDAGADMQLEEKEDTVRLSIRLPHMVPTN